VAIYQLDFLTQNCDLHCLRSTFYRPDKYNILVVRGYTTSQQLNFLKEIFLRSTLSIIFEDISPSVFQLHSISHMVMHQQFSNNYLPKLLEHHPSKTLQNCAQYNTFDFHFYQASKDTSLVELCSRKLPSSRASFCIRNFMRDPKDRVPEGWVRQCLREGEEGVLKYNGWVGLKKEYYWSGRAVGHPQEEL
jgi:hypothetical protein